MVYRFKISILKSFKSPVFKKILGIFPGLSSIKTSDDIRQDLIKKYAAGKSFVDIGCMWRVDGRFSFLAEECGAEKVMAVDIYPQSKQFLSEKERRGSRVEFIQGDINSQDVISKIGVCDVVFCSGVLYHMPDPLYFLSRLRMICAETLIFSTMAIPEVRGMRNTAVFYPFLDAGQRKIWDAGDKKKTVAQPYEPGNPYSTWFWGFSPSCVASMLQSVGFDIKERRARPFQVFYVCEAGQPRVSPPYCPGSVKKGE